MKKTGDGSAGWSDRLADLLAEAGLRALDGNALAKFDTYLALLRRWNGRINLTSVRDEEGILSRHFVESIACAQGLPAGIRTLLDLGSGGGFPGLPIAICRPEIAVTLAESQWKKAGFLREAVRSLEVKAQVHGERAEALAGSRFDCVALRAVDRMPDAVKVGAGLVCDSGFLALLTTRQELVELTEAAGAEFEWRESIPLPSSANRVFAMGARRSE